MLPLFLPPYFYKYVEYPVAESEIRGPIRFFQQTAQDRLCKCLAKQSADRSAEAIRVCSQVRFPLSLLSFLTPSLSIYFTLPRFRPLSCSSIPRSRLWTSVCMRRRSMRIRVHPPCANAANSTWPPSDWTRRTRTSHGRASWMASRSVPAMGNRKWTGYANNGANATTTRSSASPSRTLSIPSTFILG